MHDSKLLRELGGWQWKVEKKKLKAVGGANAAGEHIWGNQMALVVIDKRVGERGLLCVSSSGRQ